VDSKDAVKGKFITMSAYIKKSERLPIKNLMVNFSFFEKKNKQNPKSVDGNK
jgi:hypothetical protein